MKTRIHLAKPGRYTDMLGRTVTLDAACIKALADSYDPAKAKAPLVLGHPKTEDAAHGWIDGLEIDDKGDLWGTASQVTNDLAEAVRAGRFRNVSISWYPKGNANSPAPETETLRHVGILGAQVPAIRGLQPLAFAGDESDAITVEFSDNEAFAFWSLKHFVRNLRDWFVEREGVEVADRIIPPYTIDDLDDAGDEAIEDAPAFTDPKPEQPMPPKTTPGQQADPAVSLADRKAALDEREQQIADREAKIEREDAEKADTAAVAFADGLIAEGQLAPAGKDVVADIHKRLAASDDPVSFADGSKAPALAEFEKLLKGGGKVINLAEASAPDQSTDLDADDPVSLSDRAEEIQKERPSLTHAEAVRVAEKEAGAAS